MIAVIVAWIAYLYFFVRFLFHGFRIGGFLATAGIAALLFIVLIVWTFRQLSKPGKKARQAVMNRQAAARSAASGMDSGSVSFRVAGVSFDNEDGTSRQEILRHLKFGDSPWANDPDDLVASIEETTFDGDLAFTVFVNGYQVGFVPKASVRKVSEALQHVATYFISSVRITGGGSGSDGRDLSYGCEISLEY